ncbi:hypothetical protein HYPSUDRAFT_1073144 [Hypholoma sublateritium FD-334 SS-4]|uniref:Uncharacterized protein n=1 Tax=Hypholoma sublateritium (strain FD-334 SS-4) TaxID=945553 RepID=A0A0D2LTY1_HYPSF|nr:hypothetical protein HYPSUDRAFT_1073144 [Hypholoma sublateritium FD-334 SS-4]
MPPYQPRISTRETESTSQPHATDAESPSELWIFPPDNNPDAPPPDAHPDFEHPAQPIDTLANYSYSPLSPPQILIFFRGMEMVYKYQRNPPPMPPAVAQRIELSITAHLRRAGVLLGPQLGFQFIEEGTPIDLRFIDFPLDINLNTTRTNFGLMLQYLAPPTSLQGQILEFAVHTASRGAEMQNLGGACGSGGVLRGEYRSRTE